MKENLLFANTCGKIHADTVIFALEHREKDIPVDKIKNVEMEVGIELKSFLIILIPAAFFIFLYNNNDLDVILMTLIGFIALFFTGISLFNIKKKFKIVVTLTGGRIFKIVVSRNNRKDAKKFVEFLNRQLQVTQIKNPETIKVRDLAS